MTIICLTTALTQIISPDKVCVVDRIAAMLSRLGGRGYSVKEGFGEYGYTEFDPDPDPDPDSDFDKI